MRYLIVFIAAVLVLASFTVGISIGSWQDNPFRTAEARAGEEVSSSDAASAPAAAPLQIEVRAEVVTKSANGSQASAYTTGADNALVMVNVGDVGQAEARSGQDGNVEVAANVSGQGDAQAHVRTPDNTEMVANVVGEGSALVRTGADARDGISQPAEGSAVEPLVQTSSPRGPRNALAPAIPAKAALTISSELVNMRTGPDMAYPVLRQVTRGQQFEITARSSDRTWWQVCCVQERSGWVFADLVQTSGALDAVSVAANVPPPAPTPTAVAPVVVAPAVPQAETGQNSPMPAQPAWPFALEMATRHTEANVATIYAWVHENGQALDGLFLSVIKDGQEISTHARSSIEPLGTTKPSFPNSPEDKIYNLKMDYSPMSHPGFNPVGAWTIQLVDGGGLPLGAPTTFNIIEGDEMMELYVRYDKQP